MGVSTGLRSWASPARLAPFMIGIVAAGCGPEDVGTVDIARAKDVAAARGLGDDPGGGKAAKIRNRLHTTAEKAVQDRRQAR
mgnify:CR=1 FL=1